MFCSVSFYSHWWLPALVKWELTKSEDDFPIKNKLLENTRNSLNKCQCSNFKSWLPGPPVTTGLELLFYHNSIVLVPLHNPASSSKPIYTARFRPDTCVSAGLLALALKKEQKSSFTLNNCLSLRGKNYS